LQVQRSLGSDVRTFMSMEDAEAWLNAKVSS
jgi:hypothetical protein